MERAYLRTTHEEAVVIVVQQTVDITTRVQIIQVISGDRCLGTTPLLCSGEANRVLS